LKNEKIFITFIVTIGMITSVNAGEFIGKVTESGDSIGNITKIDSVVPTNKVTMTAEEKCDIYAKVAKIIIEAHSFNIPLSRVLALVGKPKNGNEYNRRQIIDSFGNKAHIDCLKRR
jgi:hypothetical protein